MFIIDLLRGRGVEALLNLVPVLGFFGIGMGPSHQQKQVFGEQQQLGADLTNFMKTLQQQAGQVFGMDSQIFGDITKAMEPLVAAGPNQQGFSPGELSTLRSGAISDTGKAYAHARQAVGEGEAAIGGGNAALPGGATSQIDAQLAEAGAEQTASTLNKIDVADWETGRENWKAASQFLGEAPSVFGNMPGMDNAATNAGSAAESSFRGAANEADTMQAEHAAQMGDIFKSAGSVLGGAMGLPGFSSGGALGGLADAATGKG